MDTGHDVASDAMGEDFLTLNLHATFRRGRAPAVVLILIAIGAAAGWHYLHPTRANKAQAGPPPVPVTFTVVSTADFPVYLFGLGTVQPYDTVTVRSRVDGEVLNVGFKQGQMVREGDI